MKTNRDLLSYIFGGWSLGKLWVWPWKAEAWLKRTPKLNPDIKF